MGRKRHALDHTYSSSDEDPMDRGVSRRDLEEEAELFRGHREGRKRTKEDAIYGSFLESDNEQPISDGRKSRTRRREGFEFVAASSSSRNQQKSRDASLQDRDSFESNSDEEIQEENDRIDHMRESDGSSDGGSDRGDDMGMDLVDEDEDEDEGEEDRQRREDREAAFRAQRQRDQEEADTYEDRIQRPQMGSKSGIGLASSGFSGNQESTATSAQTSSTTASKNKAIAASIRAGLGLSAEAGSLSGTDSTLRARQQGRNNNQSTLSYFKNRADLSGGASGENSPSSRPSSPASTSSPRPDVPLVAPVKVNKDYGAFSAKGSGFGLKMLEKMGWKKGYGLGTGGAGIVEPIQTKLRPVKMGIGFKGFKEKTDQTRAEEKRKGVAVSSDEDESPAKRKSKGADTKDKELKADGWKKMGGRKLRKGPKVEYKTAAEIQQEIESADMPMTLVQPQKILDMTGKTVRELSSASQISSAVAMSHERFPELRHNLELMADISTTDLEQLARAQKADHVRQQVLEREGDRMQKMVVQDEINLERLAKVLAITDQCVRIANEIQQSTTDTTGEVVIDIKENYIVRVFQEPFDLLSGLYYEEYELYQLDQVFIGALQDSFKKLLKDWDVLKNPTLGAGMLQKWQKLLRTSKVVYGHGQGPMDDDWNNNSAFNAKSSHPLKMTAYESLLSHHWLPKVRTALNNEWNARDCDPVIELLEAWAPPLLPLFIQDNIITQLILPKLQKEIDQWSPKDSLMLHTFIHPWLPVIGTARLDQELFEDIRRKLASGLMTWHVLDPSGIRVLEPWRGVFEAADLEKLLLKAVLPKLIEGLQLFEINPRDQKIELLQAILPWHHFFPSTTFSALLVNEFFPKWHQVLYLWLTHTSTTDLDQVSQWYQWWKSLFPAPVLQETGVAMGFRQGLDMINQSMSGLTIMAPADLAQAQAQSRGAANGSSSFSVSAEALGRLQTRRHLVSSVSFKDLVQDYATQNSLLFVMTKQMHERSGRPLYRLGGNSTGTAGGILVHMTDEVAFVRSEETGVWMPTSLEELMVLARGGGGGKQAKGSQS
ncbi:hypothetical protein BG011_007030 [Mortierella polycephala]|uniref:G-patch domain-containing protein n=1 Tax=Mortierella polycephala TaxID=41804 RepID=A0A9P6TY87_9FUNG|nr:hypothetical protein BG011_007030 [Mortierella polycephala]